MDATELEAAARAIVDTGRYMTLGTADADGRPWVTPVWYAHEDARTFLWVSDPGTRHSINLAGRPEVSLVIFDSHAGLNEGSGVFVRGVAEQLGGAEAERAIAVFSERSLAQGGHEWSPGDVAPTARLRLYRVTAVERDLGLQDQRHRLSS
jgi:nitroimidazol reductase NimA-like FMN-containing flavoprotein (pyridoxamine 5'-phosphate oxidase superfamily)